MINSCTVLLSEGPLGISVKTLAYYSHLVPTFLALFLGVYLLFRTKFSKLSVLFFFFTSSFSLWLLSDVILWSSSNYYHIVFFWSWLDYVNVVFFALGAYFVGVLARDTIPVWEKVTYLLLCVPAFLMTISGDSITGFNQPYCEAYNNQTLTYYKMFTEAVFSVFIVHSVFSAWKKSDKNKKKSLAVVSTSVLLFFIVFSSTEYIASVTGVYEINLYGLFVLPIFLIAMVFAITNLRIFQMRLLGTQILVYTIIIMVGSQFLFLRGATDFILNAITLLASIVFSLLLLQNAKRENEARIQIENLANNLKKSNDRLLELDKQKSEFVSFATHQLRAPLTAMKGYASMILEGDIGKLDDETREAVHRIMESSGTLANVVDDYLNISRIELGTMKYNFTKMPLHDIVDEVIGELRPNIDKSGLAFEYIPDQSAIESLVSVDEDKMKQVIANIIDNTTKYTKTGGIKVYLKKVEGGMLRFMTEDTGIGIAPEVMPKLFMKFSRALNGNRANIHGTGLGLFVAKEIVGAHKGKIWAESEGEGKGSRFYVDLPIVG